MQDLVIKEVSYRIRDKGYNLYTRHKSEDVAAIPVDRPPDIDWRYIGQEFLADDEFFKSAVIQPGDQIFCLGYPLQHVSSKETAFPILRSGIISSYPLIPLNIYRTFLFDFEIYPGNSGGPVYLYNTMRLVNNEYQLRKFFAILGLISGERNYKDKTKLKLGKVVNSYYINEVLNMFPDKRDKVRIFV